MEDRRVLEVDGTVPAFADFPVVVERDFVGIAVTEDMARSTALMERVVGRPLPVVGRENTNPNRPFITDIDPVVAARLREFNEFDVRFYEEAWRRLELSITSDREAAGT